MKKAIGFYTVISNGIQSASGASGLTLGLQFLVARVEDFLLGSGFRGVIHRFVAPTTGSLTTGSLTTGFRGGAISRRRPRKGGGDFTKKTPQRGGRFHVENFLDSQEALEKCPRPTQGLMNSGAMGEGDPNNSRPPLIGFTLAWG